MAFHDYFKFIIGNSRALRYFVPVSLAYFFFAFGWGLVAPIFSVLINNITGDLFLTGIIIGVWGIIGLVSDIPFGILVDKVSQKKLTQLSLGAYPLIVLGYTFVGDFWSLLGLRVVHAFFGALMWISIWSFIYAKAERMHKARDIGFFNELYDIGAVAAPFLGGIIALASFFAPFYLLSIFCLITFFIITLFMPDTKPTHPRVSYISLMRDELRQIKQIGGMFYYLVFFIVMVYGINTLVYGFLPVLLNQSGIDFGTIGLVIAAASLPAILMEVPMGIFIDKVGRAKAAVTGMSVAAIAMMVLSVSFALPIVVFAMFIFGIATVLLVILGNAVASELVNRDQRGGITGIVTFFKDVGNFVGPVFGGLIFSTIGTSDTMLTLSVVYLIALPPIFAAFKRKIEPAPFATEKPEEMHKTFNSKMPPQKKVGK
jgi:MFS family permease